MAASVGLGATSAKRDFAAMSKGDSSDSDDDRKKKLVGNFPGGRVSNSSCDVEGESEGETFDKWMNKHQKHTKRMKIIKKPKNDEDVFFNEFAMIHNEGPDLFADDWGDEAYSEKSSSNHYSSDSSSSDSSDSSDANGDSSKSSTTSSNANGENGANDGVAENAGAQDVGGTGDPEDQQNDQQPGVPEQMAIQPGLSPQVMAALDKQLQFIGDAGGQPVVAVQDGQIGDVDPSANIIPQYSFMDLESIPFLPPEEGRTFTERWDTWVKRCASNRAEMRGLRVDETIESIIKRKGHSKEPGKTDD